MERVRCEQIVLDSYAVGTTDIMDYADEHPNEYFDCTHVRSRHTDFGELVVSEFPVNEEKEREYEEKGIRVWHDLYNGWQRTSNCFGVWVCRKNGRYIIITD